MYPPIFLDEPMSLEVTYANIRGIFFLPQMFPLVCRFSESDPLMLFQKAAVFKIEKPFAQTTSVRGRSLWLPRWNNPNWELMNSSIKEINDQPRTTHAAPKPELS